MVLNSFNDVEKYPDLDLTLIFDTPSGMYPVVFCDTEKDAQHFLAVMKRCQPQYCKYWEFPRTKFEEYPAGIGYRIITFATGGRMQYCGQNFYKKEIAEGKRYRIIPYSDLIFCPEIDTSESSIESLFGLEV